MKLKFLIYPILAILILGGYWVGVNRQAGGLGGGQIAVLTDGKVLIDSIKTVQNSTFSTTGKYLYQPPTTDSKTGITCQTDEYDTPLEQKEGTTRVKGYQTYCKKADGSTMATGTGILAESLSYDWKLLISTSTPK